LIKTLLQHKKPVLNGASMKRTTLAPALLMVLLLLATLAASFSSIVNADVQLLPRVDLMSPSPLCRNVYHSSDVPLSFSVTTPLLWSEVEPAVYAGIFRHFVGQITSVGYSLDGRVSENVTVDDTNYLHSGPASKVFDFSFNLTKLPDGMHDVTVSVFGDYKGEAFNLTEGPVVFFVDAAPLELTVLSPESKVYNVTDISLVVTTSEPVSRMSYSLDDGERISINRNVTLANMTLGLHELTFFANDTLGKLASSETINFTIAKPPDPFATTQVVVVSVASVAFVGLGLFVYFKKLKR
jgi:hypothetical protein